MLLSRLYTPSDFNIDAKILNFSTVQPIDSVRNIRKFGEPTVKENAAVAGNGCISHTVVKIDDHDLELHKKRVELFTQADAHIASYVGVVIIVVFIVAALHISLIR